MKSGVTDLFGLTAGVCGSTTGGIGVPNPDSEACTDAITSGKPDTGNGLLLTYAETMSAVNSASSAGVHGH